MLLDARTFCLVRAFIRVALPEFEAALLAEIAEDEQVAVEKFAADLLVEMLRSRAR